jgi:uncharacterized membrane protein
MTLVTVYLPGDALLQLLLPLMAGITAVLLVRWVLGFITG